MFLLLRLHIWWCVVSSNLYCWLIVWKNCVYYFYISYLCFNYGIVFLLAGLFPIQYLMYFPNWYIISFSSNYFFIIYFFGLYIYLYCNFCFVWMCLFWYLFSVFLYISLDIYIFEWFLLLFSVVFFYDSIVFIIILFWFPIPSFF